MNEKAWTDDRPDRTTIVRAVCKAALASVAISAVLPTLALGAGPDAIGASHNGLLTGAFAVVNGVALQQTQLDATAQAVAARAGQPVTPHLIAQTRQQLIMRELLRQAAEKADYGSRPEVQQAAREATINAETQLYMRDHARPAPVTDADVKARYDAAVASLGPVEYKPRVIVLQDAPTAQRVLAALRSGQDFAMVARRYSVGPTKAAGGEMAWVSFPLPVTEGQTQGLPMPLAQALATLPVGGETSQAIRAGNVWLVVRLDAKRATQVPTFDQAKDQTRQALQAEAAQRASAQLTESLFKGATIQQ
jgi:parvulin-like peptidyl-prolyl isomerase